ncbi:HNH endonuclease family protein [Pseudonocardia asaccharolytica]|uniref:HNH endonuclease family protein n=1 Tax=Pseudonocardia asaccharolytica TaxID=54010 RepID=UPI001649D3A7|nr:HNH endonuclease family protein [Pseudonocardia asaccharolytica]
MRAMRGIRFRRTWRAVLAMVMVGALSSGCAVLELEDAGAAATRPVLTGAAATALEALPVKGRAPKTGYEREKFGPAWADVDDNGCDTRNDILKRDLSGAELKPGARGCIVLAGLLADPYSGEDILFHRGKETSSAVQIDHVVALSDAWQKGAQQLTEQQRREFANDPLNLLAVSGPLNQQKGDADAATWLPPSHSYRCAYVARQVAVKTKHRLWVTEAERDAIAGLLEHCPGEPLPSDTALRPAA